MIYDGKLYLNLEKQVQKNKEDIEYIINEEGALNQFGLRVVGQVETVSDMPTVTDYKANNPNWEYGDAFIVGASQEDASIVDVTNATLLVLTRANTVYPNDFWMNLGEFPKPGPQGIQGIQGEQGIQGVKGLDVLSGVIAPTSVQPSGTTYINATTGDVYRYGDRWVLIGNIKGVQGAVGATGPQGKQGPIGPTGATGPQGERGIGVNILGTLTSTSQLPSPTSVAKDSAYIIPVDGINHLYVIEGTDNLVWTDFGTAGIGEKGDKGDAGIGIDTMTDLDLTYGDTTVTYDTTDGMAINGQARFTYNGGTTKDVTMDVEVPIVAGDGITIDKKADAEQVEIKADSAYFDGKYVPRQDGVVGQSRAYTVRRTTNAIYQESIKVLSTAEASSIALRSDGGALKVGTPSADEDAVNISYANTNFRKRFTVGAGEYAYISNAGGDGSLQVDGNPTAQTIAKRGANGVLKVGTPTAVNDATTKAYVDGLHHYTHSIYLKSITGENEICVTVAVKNIPNPATVLNRDSAYASISVEEIIATATQNEDNFVMATGNIDYADNRCFVIGLSYNADEQVTARVYDPSINAFNTATLSDLGEWFVSDTVA